MAETINRWIVENLNIANQLGQRKIILRKIIEIDPTTNYLLFSRIDHIVYYHVDNGILLEQMS